jgi:hypothetical protein
VTRPVLTGSPTAANTIGMTDVACFAATTGGVPDVTIRSTGNNTRKIRHSTSIRSPRLKAASPNLQP